MAFLPGDDDAMRAFEAALSFVDEYALDPAALGAVSAQPAPLTPLPTTAPSPLLEDLPLSPLVPELSARSPSVADDSGESESSAASTSSSLTATSVGLSSGELSAPGAAGTLLRRQSHGSSAAGKKKSATRKPRTRGDPNRARNERKIELAYLREKVGQLELELHALHVHHPHRRRVKQAASPSHLQAFGTQQGEHSAGTGRSASGNSTVSLSGAAHGSGVSSVWREVAGRQRRRREKAERENVRLRLILENQIKMAKSLESLLQKRAKQQVVECSGLTKPQNPGKYSHGRKLDYRADVEDFRDLLAHLDRAYREVDTVFGANGLHTMETTHRDARMREGPDCMYLDIFATKVMPFEMRATAQAVWNHYKGAEKHRGNMYEKVAKHLETPDTIIEDFAKEFFADSARADFHAKQVLRRYVEADREIVVWCATVVPLEFADKRVQGLGFRHQGYALTKRAAAATPENDVSLLQLCSLAWPEKSGDHTVYDPAVVRALTDFMLGTVAGNITASQELIENVLMDQTVKLDRP